jgi:hypothetical protein
MINITEIKRIMANLARAKNDPLLEFVMNGEPDALDLERIRDENLQLLFTTTRKYKVRYIYIDKTEICGCESKNDGGGTWPAMWAIAKAVGFSASCGNHDQYQCHCCDIVFPADSYGAWDLKENRKLSDDETAEKKFHRVAPHFRKRDYA